MSKYYKFCPYLIAIMAIYSCNGDMTPEIHYLPSNYVGPVYIYFNQSDGVKCEYLENRRLYKIPANGNLKTRFKPNPGWIKDKNMLEFYYVNDSGKPIRRLNYSYNFNSDSIAKYNNIGVTKIVYHSMTIKKEDLVYVKYIVDTLNKISIKYPNYDNIGPGMPLDKLNK